MTSCLGYYIVGSGNGMGKEVFTENFYVPLSQMWFFNHWYHCESGFLVLTVSWRPQHHLWSQYRPQTSTWPFSAVWTADIMRALGSTQANDITSNMSLRATCFMDTNMSPVGSPFHRDEHGFRSQHRPQTSFWPLVVTQTIDKTWLLPHGQVQ